MFLLTYPMLVFSRKIKPFLVKGYYLNFVKNIKDIHRERAPSHKTPALRKSTNMGVWAVGTLNQLFKRGSSAETKLSKK